MVECRSTSFSISSQTLDWYPNSIFPGFRLRVVIHKSFSDGNSKVIFKLFPPTVPRKKTPPGFCSEKEHEIHNHGANMLYRPFLIKNVTVFGSPCQMMGSCALLEAGQLQSRNAQNQSALGQKELTQYSPYVLRRFLCVTKSHVSLKGIMRTEFRIKLSFGLRYQPQRPQDLFRGWGARGARGAGGAASLASRASGCTGLALILFCSAFITLLPVHELTVA